MKENSPSAEKAQNKTIDDLYRVIGEFGKYQLSVFVFVGLLCTIPALLTYAYVFIGATPEYRCALPDYDNDTFEIQSDYHQELVSKYIVNVTKDHTKRYDGCKIRTLFNETDSNNQTSGLADCSKYVYSKKHYGETAVVKWNWVCKNQAKKSLFSSLMFVGFFFIAAVGPLSDRFGRKRALQFCIGMNVISNFSIALVTVLLNKHTELQQILFGFFRFTSGMSTSFYSIAVVLGMEMVGPSYRAAAGSCMYYFYIFGELINVLIAYLIRDISMNYIAVSVILILCIIGLGVIPESPRFLLIKRKQSAAYDTFLNIAKSNKTTSEFINFIQGQDLEKLALANEKAGDDETANYSFLGSLKEFFQSRKLLLQTLATLINWAANSFVYYGISLNTGALSGDPYLNAAYSALVEFVGVAACHYSISRFGRKIPYAIFMLLSGLSLVCVQFVVDQPVYVNVLALISKLSISFTFNAIYIVTAESYPTVIRSTVVTICGTIAKVGNLMAPFVQALGVYSFSLPFLIFGGASMLAATFHILFTPETRKAKLRDNFI